MDMDMGCDPSVWLLPVDDVRCIKALECCQAFYAATNESQAAVPWASQFRYGHWTVWYWITLLGLLTAWHAYNTIMDRLSSRRTSGTASSSSATSSGTTTTKVGVVDKARAAGRFCSYRCLSQHDRYSCITLPDAGMFVVLAATIVFLLVIVFAEKPYYRLHYGFGSPPLAIRCGLIAFGMLPITVALAGKANFVTLLTGISHERLNVVHQWVGWMLFVVSCVHAFPFLVASYRDVGGNGGYQRVKLEFYRDAMGVSEYSGTPPFGMLFGLCILSIRQVRERFYEAFYIGHILMSIAFVGMLFWHSGQERDSWTYLWATIAVWLASWCVRLFWSMRSTCNIRGQWFEGAPATVKLLPAHLVRIEVQRPPGFNFKPAQHCFLRFHHFAPLDHHPFTIASAPTSSLSSSTPQHDAEKAQPANDNPLVFLVKVRDGFTRRLAARCEMTGGSPAMLNTTVCVDGPYGGLPYPRLEHRFDALLLVAGGSGVSACLPWLLHTAALTHRVRLCNVTLVWVFRGPLSFDWVAKELQQAVHAAGPVTVKVRLHVTGDADFFGGSGAQHASKEKEKENDGKEMRVDAISDPLHERMKDVGDVFAGRPEPRDDVKAAKASMGHGMGKRLFVFSCGPSGLNDKVANACAGEQRSVWRGEVKEVECRVETFSW
ncbi:ferric reductase NAD binding domain-containing protein [Phyllosticta citriasiana]|uniref:ferric-chelate reductase (NADPH) n=1 Tax=Phyllosticta citriasiana TaxID=595635 RepID=A0ABR1KZ53_9PEZI